MESSGDEDDGADDEYYGLDNAAIAKMVKDLPPLRPQPTPPVDVNDANVQLAHFRFSLEKPETLEAILLARADPNLLVGDGDISPLQKAMLFTRDQKDVVRMREHLLEHGASESAYERLRWNERRAADAGEPAWLRNFHRSAQLLHFTTIMPARGNSITCPRGQRKLVRMYVVVRGCFAVRDDREFRC